MNEKKIFGSAVAASSVFGTFACQLYSFRETCFRVDYVNAKERKKVISMARSEEKIFAAFPLSLLQQLLFPAFVKSNVLFLILGHFPFQP